MQQTSRLAPKDQIESIRTQYLGSPQIALDSLCGAINRLQKAFPRRGHFFVEFIQNADDARSKSMKIELSKDTIRISNDGKPSGTYTGEALRPRLQALMTPWMNEGFFARLVVLVEGEDDRAVVVGMAKAKGYQLESIGIAVIPCMGKTNIDRPAAIFSALGIPTYGIWDSDFGQRDARPQDNHRLLSLFGSDSEDWPEKVCNRFTCFRVTLEKKFSEEIGDALFKRLLGEVSADYSFGKPEFARKNPSVIEELISRAKGYGKSSPTIERVVSEIIGRLRP